MASVFKVLLTTRYMWGLLVQRLRHMIIYNTMYSKRYKVMPFWCQFLLNSVIICV